jgi:hypothetical protein
MLGRDQCLLGPWRREVLCFGREVRFDHVRQTHARLVRAASFLARLGCQRYPSVSNKETVLREFIAGKCGYSGYSAAASSLWCDRGDEPVGDLLIAFLTLLLGFSVASSV